MAKNTVTVSGMFGEGHTYFADSPVIIDISGLEWPVSSPFNIIHIEVVYENNVVGHFQADTGGLPSISFDISSALRALWSDYRFAGEVAAAQNAVKTAANPSPTRQPATRNVRDYFLRINTEYMSSDNVFTTTQCVVVIDGVEHTDIPGGQCLMGGMTELERSVIEHKEDADVAHLEHTGVRNGDASTKPISSPERVGVNSITSWVDVQDGLTKSIFYPANTIPEADDVPAAQTGWTRHAPLVLRDSQPYVDFLFINRRGAVETCSGLMKEEMDISADVKQYTLIERPTFKPSRSLMAIGNDGRRSWKMSSGYVTREWAEWWTMEFLGGKRKQWWMLWQGPGVSTPRYVPVVIKPAKNDIPIYDKAKQQLAHIDFTVTLALEG